MMEGSSDMYLIERIWGGRAAEIEDLNLIVEVLQESYTGALALTCPYLV